MSAWDRAATAALIAGVSGGVGTSSIARCLAEVVPGGAVDMGLARDARAHILVMSMTAASAARLPAALRRYTATYRPVLVVSHTLAGEIPRFTRAELRAVEPHVSAVVHFPHVLLWANLPAPPASVPSARAQLSALKSIVEALRRNAT